MKQVFILQNSYISFGLDAKLIYQKDKYDLFLIVNQFGYDIVKNKNQQRYYKKIIITNDFSVETIKNTINSLRDEKADFNIITNSEETMPVCGIIRVLMGIDKNDYSRFYDKDAMKKALSKSNAIKIPKYKLYNASQFQTLREGYLDELTADMRYPLFIKPVTLYGSMSLTKINDRTDLHKWAITTSPDTLYEIDEFIDGTMYHCDSYIKNQEILFTFISKNSRPCYNFTVGEMKGTIVLPENHPDTTLLTRITEQALTGIGMPDSGVTHMELIKTKDDQIYFIEIAHRAPGCLIPNMYKEHANIDTVASHYLLQIDAEYHPKPDRKTYAAWACFPKKPGVITKLKRPPNNLTSTIDISWVYRVGDVIKTYSKFGRDYTGTIFLTNPNFESLLSDFIRINDNNLCDIMALDEHSF